jgi:hypothetical protein
MQEDTEMKDFTIEEKYDNRGVRIVVIGVGKASAMENYDDLRAFLSAKR